jgi:chromosome segregation protein
VDDADRQLGAAAARAAELADELAAARETARDRSADVDEALAARQAADRTRSAAAAALAELGAERNDATLAEYADRLAERTGTRRSPSAVRRALKRLALARKKRRSGPPSRGAPRSPSSGRRGAPSWPGSTRAGSSSSTRAGSTPG